MQNSADDRGFTPINIEARRQHDQVRATLQRHEGRHGGTHAELSCFVIARRQNAAAFASAAHAHRFAEQRRTVAHLDCRIKAVHVEMNDGACFRSFFHTEISHNGEKETKLRFSRSKHPLEIAESKSGIGCISRPKESLSMLAHETK